MKPLLLLLSATLLCATSCAHRMASFQMSNDFEVVVPEGAKRVQAWFAMPDRNDASQTVSGFRVDSPHPYRIVKDQFGNEYVYFDIENPSEQTITATEHFKISRIEVTNALDIEKV